MLLSRSQFDDKLEGGRLNIAFIGMSNIGKSYLSKHIEEHNGFARIDVDKQIQIELGLTSMSAIADWLGHPYDTQYQTNARAYLKHEGIISLNETTEGGNTVLDTTGSVIHLAKTTQNKIKARYLVVYLKASEDDLVMLKERYFRHPKPTIWPQQFIAKMDDSTSASGKNALMHLFPNLLAYRAGLYENMSDIIIPAQNFHGKLTNNEGILAKIRSALTP